MERVFRCGVVPFALAFLSMMSIVSADIPVAKSTPAKPTPLIKGDAAGAFYVTKIAGAKDDGVDVGQELCYRCRYGSRPIVMVFARRADDKLSDLMVQLDKAVQSSKESQLRGLVTLLNDDLAKAKDNANKLADKTGVKLVPIVVAKDNATGPPNYKLNQSSDVTIVMASDSQVVWTRAYSGDSVDVLDVMSHVKALIAQSIQ
ncbi:hypothetical protein [Planctomycetes bacterium K23_9]|uniref:Thioredoxin domain-containing protein n=1 Tax=Stieleria marina TaxID=1930275 RepID=A0A517P346_9BACT|nr:hypothetical protein K239x_58110 [Planctomycetes bacterium K23_9]